LPFWNKNCSPNTLNIESAIFYPSPNSDNIWGIDRAGIQMMLKRLNNATVITYNPHRFIRDFTCQLRKAGVDTMTIKDLGR